jgi:hypothetical protein
MGPGGVVESFGFGGEVFHILHSMTGENHSDLIVVVVVVVVVVVGSIA